MNKNPRLNVPCLLFLSFPLHFHRRKKKPKRRESLHLISFFFSASLFPLAKEIKGNKEILTRLNTHTWCMVLQYDFCGRAKELDFGALCSPWASCSRSHSASFKVQSCDASVMSGRTQRKYANVDRSKVVQSCWPPVRAKYFFNKLLKNTTSPLQYKAVWVHLTEHCLRAQHLWALGKFDFTLSMMYHSCTSHPAVVSLFSPLPPF